LLAELGASLSTQLEAAVPGWVVGQVGRIVDAWAATDPPGGVDRGAVRAEAIEAGRRAAEDVGSRLRVLLAADLDAQWTTPLEIVRGAVTFPTAVLLRAGVPPVVRDAFDEGRFPDDVYGLVPASLSALDPALTDPARAWGAAKAMAHKARHGGSGA
jgi:hypothetical protein